MSRRSLLAQAHLAAKQLGLSDDQRRDVQREIAGRESCKDMSERQLHRLLDHYKSLGWRARAPRRAGQRQQATFPQARLIRALWLELKGLGALRDPSERALDRYVERITGVAALAWLAKDPQQANRVIETLKRWVQRIEDQQKEGP